MGWAPSIALDRRQRIVVMSSTGQSYAAIWRLLEDGAADRRVARNGRTFRVMAAERMAPLRDGGFLVSGSWNDCDKYGCDGAMGMTLTRLDPSLRRDRGYGEDGERTFRGIAGQVSDTAVRPDGSTVSIGWGNEYPEEDRSIMVAADARGRELARAELPSGGGWSALDLDPHGRILATAYGPDLTLRRYSPAFEADEAYGAAGAAIVPDQPDPDHDRRLPSDPDVHALPDGGALVVTEAHVARVTPDGSIASRFRLPPGFRVMDMTADRRGRALLAGDFSEGGTSPGPDSHAAVMRLTRAGRRDGTFGTRGVFRWKRRSFGTAVAVDRRGRVVLAAGLHGKRVLAAEEGPPRTFVLRLRG